MARQVTSQAPGNRYHSLDSLRATMMMLGLVLHTSINYVPILPVDAGWPYQDAQTSPMFDWLIVFIHVFRMPVFFTVAGFFAAYLLETRGAPAFLRHRWNRIGIPLFVGVLVMLPATGGAMFYAQQFSAAPPLPDTAPQAASLDVLWNNLLMHLWFLYYLLLFCLAAALLASLARRVPEGWRIAFLDIFGRFVNRGMIVILAALSGITLHQMESWSFDYHGGLLPPARIPLSYALFFLFGWLLYLRRDALDGFKRPAWFNLAAGIVFFLVHRHFVNTGCADMHLCNTTATLEHVGAIAFLAPAVWFLVYGFLGVFLRYLDTPNPRWRYLLDASYWMYIVHPPVVMVLPTFLAPVALPAGIKFALVLGVATILILISYHYCVRSTFIGRQLNGRRYPRRFPWRSPVASEQPFSDGSNTP